jgi:hypothetical protein
MTTSVSGLSISITDVDEDDSLMATGESEEVDLLEKLAHQPCWSIDGKRYEGFVRRRRADGERISSSDRSNKWQKCWMVAKDSLLYIYQSQMVRRTSLIKSPIRVLILDRQYSLRDNSLDVCM